MRAVLEKLLRTDLGNAARHEPTTAANVGQSL
jgi:hypothetical protein